ncbi:MAG: NAD-dependent epimerase/dehydratase family protein [Alphaproteobacteria bacterium]|nr:NAD-dependent epimerase/dehydratase family protein [Alphaproteobacteria bacterium]
MQALVTGGAGFIGSHLVDALLARGAKVRVIDDLSSGHPESVHPDAELVVGDIRDVPLVTRLMEGVDVVLHEAARNSIPRSLKDPKGAFEVNLVGTYNLLIAARDARVGRFVYASSSSIYGDNPVLPRQEDLLPSPVSMYAGTKAAMEDLCAGFSAAFGLPSLGLRYFNVFGPRQDPANPYAAVVPLWVRAALRGEAATIFGDGSQTRDFTFVENVVRANMMAVDADATRLKGAVNIATGGIITVLELHRAIADAVGAYVPPRHVPPRPGDQPFSQADLDRARALLGFAPSVSFQEGIRRTVAWYRAGGADAWDPSAAGT